MLALVAMMSSIFTISAYKLVGFDRNLVIFEASKSGNTDENLVKLAKKDGDTKAGKLDLPADFIAAAEKTTPTVVHIFATQDISKNQRFQNNDIPDFFRDFFGDDFGGNLRKNPRGPQQAQSSGSGVILSQDGYIVTNNHVVANASSLEVTMNDQRTYKAEVIGTSPEMDLAVIKIKETNLPHIVFGNSDNVKVGEWVLAVGNPFNLESTVTAGIVSAKGRNLNILREKGLDAIESFIQTDAAVNPGNSGGALINTQGELIGINTAIATPTGTYAGYSFAVPVNIVRKVVKDLIEYGTVQRGYLGVTIRQLDGKYAEEKGIKNISEGVYVESVAENSAAKEAGVQAGDVIVGLDGKKIKSSPELLEEIAKRRPGNKVKLDLIRDGKPKAVEVFLKNKAGNEEIVKKEVTSDISKTLGAEFSDLKKEEKQKLKLDGGAKVSRIYGGKIGNMTDIREGFIITKVNGEPVKSVDDFMKKVEKIEGGIFLSGVYPDVNGEYYYAFGK